MKSDLLDSRTCQVKQMMARHSVYQVALIAFTIYGMACKFLFSLNLPLNSDQVIPGSLAMEMWLNGNYLLKGIYLNSLDSQLFNDILLFHLVPQVLTDFNPDVLRTTAFAIFFLTVVIFSYIVFIVTKDKTNALVFAALMANITPISYSYFVSPMSHIAAILSAGVFIILFLTRFNRLSDVDGKDRKGLVEISLLLILMVIFTFSDFMFAVFFTFPVAGYYLFFYGKKSYRSGLFAGMLLMTVVSAFIFSKFIVNKLGLAYFITLPVLPAGIEKIVLVNIPLYVKGLLLLVNGNLYIGLTDVANFGLIEVLTAVLFLVVLGLAVKNMFDGRADQRKIVLAFFIFSVAVTFSAYVFTTLCVNIFTTRYLTFTALLVFLLISVYFSHKNKAMTLSILLILVIFSVVNINTVKTLDYHPSQGQYDIIDYLRQNNLTFGYSDYWDSNIITYLSGGDIIIRPVTAGADGLRPFRSISTDEWYKEKPDRYFLLINNENQNQVNGFRALIETIASSSVYQHKSYTIYLFENTTNINDKLLFSD